tara:strand:+ start:28 stop:405 length:378 start_codon:yes stop_codon:yes gene_type:complete
MKIPIKNIDHYGHIYTSINELDKIIKPYEISSFFHKKAKGHFYESSNDFKMINYAYYEIISNSCYWFRVQKPLEEIKDNNQKYWFSIYGQGIICLEFFKMYTNLKPICNSEYIRLISSPYKEFKS